MQFKGTVLIILVRWRQSNAQDATVKKTAEQFELNRLGHVAAAA